MNVAWRMPAIALVLCSLALADASAPRLRDGSSVELSEDADEALLGLALHSRVGASTIEQSQTDLEEEIDAWGRRRRRHCRNPHSHNPHNHNPFEIASGCSIAENSVSIHEGEREA